MGLIAGFGIEVDCSRNLILLGVGNMDWKIHVECRCLLDEMELIIGGGSKYCPRRVKRGTSDSLRKVAIDSGSGETSQTTRD